MIRLGPWHTSGTIYARGDALWLYFYSGGDRRESVGKLLGKDPLRTRWSDAVGALKQCLEKKAAAKALGAPLLTPKQERVTVRELLDEYQAHRLLEGVKDMVGFKKATRANKRWWGHLVATKLTRATLEAAIQVQLDKGFARGTVRTRLHGLFAALHHAKDRLPNLPDKPEVTVPLTRKGTVQADELARFCEAAQPWPWLAAVAQFGYLTGWRISEVLGLTWDRVDFKQALLFLEETKTDDPRVRPIEPELLAILKRRSEVRRLGCALVFHVDGLRIKDSRFYERWRQVCRAAGMEGKFFHDMRRGAYDRFLLNGMNLVDAMDLVGHRSLSSARRYARPNIERMRLALERVDTHISRTADRGNGA